MPQSSDRNAFSQGVRENPLTHCILSCRSQLQEILYGVNNSMDISKLVEEGCGVGELRKRGVSPSDIRRAGFTFTEMSAHLGVDRLYEAGFGLSDFQDANFPIEDLVRKFTIEELVKSGKYSLEQLVRIFPPTICAIAASKLRNSYHSGIYPQLI